MIHFYLSVSGNSLVVVLTTYIVIVVCRRDSSVDFTRLQYITILEAGRMAHLSSNNNVQRLFLMSDEGNFVCRHVEQIRTASRDGDRAVGVKPDCRCGVSSISIESDQPVSNVFL